MIKKRQPDQYLVRVEKGALVPSDQATVERLREKGYKIGDELVATFKKARNPKFHRLAHALGMLVVEQIEGFENHTAHTALKRLQLEARVACDEIAIKVPDFGMVIQSIPRSLSFASMDEGEFQETMKALARHIAAQYWAGMDEEDVLRMIEVMP